MTIDVAPRTAGTLPGWARGPVLTIAAATGALLLAVSGRYGYFIDELYFLAAGRDLAWGYADQPWLLPALARAMETIAPGSVVALRLPVTLVAVAGVLTTAGLARELGGARRAQTLAAALYAGSSAMLWANHTLATHALDPALWAGICWLLVRWTRVRDDRLLLAAAALTTVALQAKYLVPVLWTAVLIGALLAGPRRLLTRPALWAGLALAAASAVPSLWWQATHGWPQLAMTRLINADQGGLLGRLTFVPAFLVSAGVLTAAAAAVHGLYCLLRRPALARYRHLGVAVVLAVVAFAVLGGRPTYVTGLLPLLWAVSATELAAGRAARWWRWTATWPVLAVSATAAILITLPVLPVRAVDPADPLLTAPGTTGWPQLTDAVAAVAPRLPDRTVIVTASYGQAAALTHFRDGRFDEPITSPDRGYWFLATPPPESDAALVVGDVPDRLRSAFTAATPLGTFQNPQGIATLNGRVDLTLLTGRTTPWPQLWDDLRNLPPVG